VFEIEERILSPEQQRAERARLKALFRPSAPMRRQSPQPPKIFRQLAGIGEPYRAALNALAAAILAEWPDVAPSALFGRSRDADDLEARRAFLALLWRNSPLRSQRIAAIVGYDRSVAGRACARIEREIAQNSELAAKFERIEARFRKLDAFGA
jgi:hypothetical protein